MELVPMIMKRATTVVAGDTLLLDEGPFTVMRVHYPVQGSCIHMTCLFLGRDHDGDMAYFECRPDINFAVIML